MKWIAILCSLACGLRLAQAAGDAQPAPSNVTGASYPRIDSENRATFQLRAPDAQKVQAQVYHGLYDMTKGSNGVWSVTTPPLVPGFHYYSLVVDGVAVNDPGSHTFYGTGKDSSGIEVPEKGVDFYSCQDVPHGDVRIHSYYLQDYRPVAALLCLYSAGLRQQRQRALSGSLFAARAGRRRDWMDFSGPRKPDSR